MHEIELTILMPCLDEAETLETCICKANEYLATSGITGEILIADNGSVDGSQSIARRCGARIIDVSERGYGAALIAGTQAARGRYVIMGDADDSYDFLHLDLFVEKLREGYDLVMGNRFAGGIEEGAMPPLHRYLGNPVLSFIGRLFYGSEIGDFHCGLRGYNRDSILSLGLRTTGMEYASEMVVKSELFGLRITEVPTTLSKDGRSRAPHLRSWHDGWRHLKFLLMHSPNWLFFYPGAGLLAVGLAGALPLLFGDIALGSVTLGVHSLMYFAAFVVVGVLGLSMAYLTRMYAKASGYIPGTAMPFIFEKLSLERGLIVGALLIIMGIVMSIVALTIWGASTRFGDLIPEQMMRVVIPAVSLVIVGVQLCFTSFFAGILQIPHR